MITIIPTAKNRCSIEFHLGNSYTIHHMQTQMVEAFVLRTLKHALLRYARLIREDLESHPTCSFKISRTGALRAFHYGIQTLAAWDKTRLLSYIRQNESLLLRMLPRPAASGYQKLSQWAFDILIIASQDALNI
jgi:hypothetical protein